MNTAKLPHDRATADEAPADSRGPRDREGLVTGLSVAAVTIAAVLAAVMQSPPERRPDAPRLALAGAEAPQRHAPAACAECGVVETAVPLDAAPAETGASWQMRIRMDDGTMRTVQQRGALAAGSRVIVAGGSVRVLSSRPGQG